jgi:hypothetical protein
MKNLGTGENGGNREKTLFYARPVTFRQTPHCAILSHQEPCQWICRGLRSMGLFSAISSHKKQSLFTLINLN